MIVFIDTHGRPNKQFTYETLINRGYTGDIVFIVDDEDDTVPLLKQNYPNNEVVMFHKQAYVDTVDSGTNNSKRELNLYARCACEDIARSYNCEAFVMADDDILDFRYRYVENDSLKSYKMSCTADKFIEYYTEFMLDCDLAMISTGMPQMYFTGKDFEQSMWKWRVPFNFVFRNSAYSIDWVSAVEEECVTAINSMLEGKNSLCVPFVQHTINPLAQKEGGMFDAYSTSSPFKLSQHGHIFHPTASVPYYYKTRWMSKTKRDNAFAKIISSSFKKS